MPQSREASLLMKSPKALPSKVWQSRSRGRMEETKMSEEAKDDAQQVK